VYIGLYDEMLEIQTSVEIPDPAAALRKIAFRLRSRLPRQEHLALFAKFMETGGMASTLAEALGMDSRTETEFRKLCSADPFADPDLDECFLLLRGARIPDSPGRRCHILARSDFAGEFLILKVPGIETYFIRVSDSAPVTADGVPLLPGAAHRLSPTAILADGRSVKIYPAELMAAFSVDAEARGRLDFEGERLDFRYPGSADIGLHDFSFSLRGGSLVAIMGGSGAGKSTLLSILTGKIRPTSGSMRIDGLPWGRGDAATEGFVGYVPQDDLLFEDLSVFENLYYNARLCLADLDDAEIRKRCETTLKELNQLDIASLKVGTPLDKTISGGQRKRLNIALELIREPPILFLDEPTSGLSSADSENVIGLLKAQAAKGRIVVATIHQPSSAVYRMFDRLWVLDAGGRPIFDGNPLDALVHFRTQGYRTGTGEYSCPQCGTVHPEQLFDIIEEKKVDESGNPTKIRKVSPSDWHARYLKAREAAVKPGAGRSPAAQSGEGKSGTGHLRRPSPLGQFAVFFIRTAKTRIANRGYLLINLFEPPLLAALAGILFHGSWGIQYVFRENVNLPGYFFMSMVIAVFLGLSVASDEIHRDRSILERERLLRLGWGSYIASKAAWLALVASYQMGIYALIGNAILQIPDMGAMMWGILASASFCAAILGLIVSATLKSAVHLHPHPHSPRAADHAGRSDDQVRRTDRPGFGQPERPRRGGVHADTLGIRGSDGGALPLQPLREEFLRGRDDHAPLRLLPGCPLSRDEGSGQPALLGSRPRRRAREAGSEIAELARRPRRGTGLPRKDVGHPRSENGRKARARSLESRGAGPRDGLSQGTRSLDETDPERGFCLQAGQGRPVAQESRLRRIRQIQGNVLQQGSREAGHGHQSGRPGQRRPLGHPSRAADRPHRSRARIESRQGSPVHCRQAPRKTHGGNPGLRRGGALGHDSASLRGARPPALAHTEIRRLTAAS
jgi:ABC-type multidrug transport system ATPase subunit